MKNFSSNMTQELNDGVATKKKKHTVKSNWLQHETIVHLFLSLTRLSLSELEFQKIVGEVKKNILSEKELEKEGDDEREGDVLVTMVVVLWLLFER